MFHSLSTKWLTIALCCLLIPISLWSQETTPSPEFSAQLDDLRNELSLHKREVKLMIDESSSDSNRGIILNVAALLLAIASGPASVIIAARLDRKRLEGLVSAKVAAQLDKELPGLTTQFTHDYLKREVPAQVDAHLEVVRKYQEDSKAKTSTVILVVADDLDMANTRAAKLRDLGFLDVRTSTPKGYDEMPPHEILFVEHPGKEGSYDSLSKPYIQRLINKFAGFEKQDKGIFFYFSARYEGLDFGILSVKGICNMESKIEPNLMDLIRQIQRNK